MSKKDAERLTPILPDADVQYTDAEDYPPLSRAEKVISYATTALTMLLLGGSLVFWWIVARYLLLNPHNLADAEEMAAVLVCCAAVPLVVTVIQALLKRSCDIEHWLVCMCVSGAVSAVLVVLYQICIRNVPFQFSDLPTLLCCTVSGSALPSVIYLGIRLLLPRLAPVFRSEKITTRAAWEAVRDDVLSLTDFDL